MVEVVAGDELKEVMTASRRLDGDRGWLAEALSELVTRQAMERSEAGWVAKAVSRL